MIDYIRYFYNINASNIRFVMDKYYFDNEGKKYMMYDCTNHMLGVSYYVNEMLTNSKYFRCFKIIKNRDDELISIINGKNYVLLELDSEIIDRKITVDDLRPNLYVSEDVATGLSKYARFPWPKLWEQKIDYLENWMVAKSEKYKHLHSYISYFIGLSENALQYVKQANAELKIEKCDRLTVQHDRVRYTNNLYDYYDPLNLVIDHGCRDICEYFKSKALDGKFEIQELDNYLKCYSFSKYWISAMYSRLLFPTFLYDQLEAKNMEINTTVLSKFDEQIENYENFLSKISIYLDRNYGISTINWLKKT